MLAAPQLHTPTTRSATDGDSKLSACRWPGWDSNTRSSASYLPYRAGGCSAEDPGGGEAGAGSRPGELSLRYRTWLIHVKDRPNFPSHYLRTLLAPPRRPASASHFDPHLRKPRPLPVLLCTRVRMDPPLGLQHRLPVHLVLADASSPKWFLQHQSGRFSAQPCFDRTYEILKTGFQHIGDEDPI